MIVEKVIDLMKEKKLDALLVSSMYNYRYISGFTGDTAYLYISDNRRVLLTDSRYTTWARSEAKGFEVVEVDVQNTYSDIVSRYLDDKTCIETMYFDGGFTVIARYENGIRTDEKISSPGFEEGR